MPRKKNKTGTKSKKIRNMGYNSDMDFSDDYLQGEIGYPSEFGIKERDAYNGSYILFGDGQIFIPKNWDDDEY